VAGVRLGSLGIGYAATFECCPASDHFTNYGILRVGDEDISGAVNEQPSARPGGTGGRASIAGVAIGALPATTVTVPVVDTSRIWLEL